MKKQLLSYAMVLCAAYCFFFCACAYGGDTPSVKKPNVCGNFYPSDPRYLRTMVDGFISRAVAFSEGDHVTPVMIIAPHAGYVFSGPVAGSAYRVLAGRDFEVAVILARNHTVCFKGASLYPAGYFNTPMGNVAIDADMARALAAKTKSLRFFPEAFEGEWSLEVQLPFLQSVLPQAKIVAIMFSEGAFAELKEIGEALAHSIIESGKKTIIIASTDLSHYYSYEEAQKLDHETIAALRTLDAHGIYEKAVSERILMCGFPAVVTGIVASSALGAREFYAIDYRNSGDTQGDKTKVVGYVAAVAYATENTTLREAVMFDTTQKKRLLSYARQAIAAHFKESSSEAKDEQDPVLQKPYGVFVTLREKGELRGCIGTLTGAAPLAESVRDMAVAAATQDPRFSPVTPQQMHDIEIEISVLSPLERVKDAEQIVLGTHGVLVKKGFSSGVFLPQVAEETRWSKEEFLSYLCLHKAGLSKDAWKDPATELYIFTADVFSEGDVR